MERKKLELKGFIKKEKASMKPKGWKRIWKITSNGSNQVKTKKFVYGLNVETMGMRIREFNLKKIIKIIYLK